METGVLASAFDALWESLVAIGRDPSTGGYHRLAYTDADLACRAWFFTAAHDRGLDVETDGNGNLWAWWTGSWGGHDDGDAFVMGSHLDSVSDGGAFDGALGVVSAFATLDVLRARGRTPRRPVAVVAFADEEGARFGVACAGSRLLTGALDAERGAALRDDQGVTLADALAATGHDPQDLGRDDERLSRIGAYVELHIEQGRRLVHLDTPVGVATDIWPHGRYRITFVGDANHAGTTPMHDRADAVQAWARAAVAVDAAARLQQARATFGRLTVTPDSINVVPSRVDAWLDARAVDEPSLERLLAAVRDAADTHARATGTRVEVTDESVSAAVSFDSALRSQVMAAVEAASSHRVALLPTAAGHDAGVLTAAGVPSAMLFVRNRTGVSHSAAEHADRDDCLAGVVALVGVVERLAC